MNAVAASAVGVQLQRLVVRYPGAQPRPPISLELAPGGYTLIAGPTGAGKSTLALALGGVLETMTHARVRGGIRVGEHELRTLEPAARSRLTSAVWQHPEAQLAHRTVYDEVCAGLDYRRVPAEEGLRRSREAIELVGLGHLAPERDPLTLSGGEQQRLALAAALVLETPLLVLDEATSQLDPDAIRGFTAAIDRARARRPLTLVAIDHRITPHLGRADRLLVLDAEGRIAFDGDPSTLTSDTGRCTALGLGLPEPAAERRWHEASPPSDPALRMTAVQHRVRDRVLLQASLALPRGAVALVTGPNGSGKTTLLRALAGSITTTGEAVPSRRARIRLGIGSAPQNGGDLALTESVRSELHLVRAASRTPIDTDALLALAGLDHLAHAHPQRLSTGQRQRLSVLLAVAGSPGLLLLDEPTSAQDAAGARRVQDLAAHGAADRVTLIATHEPSTFETIATHRIRLDAGRVTAVETR